LAESKTSHIISGKATGEFLAGDLVTFSLNGTEYSAAVNAAGDWSVEVAGADLAAETTIHATLVAHDEAGNSASVVADHPYSVDLDPPVATLTIDVVAGDDILNLAESKTSQTISGKAGGEFLAGDIVSFTLNGHAYSAAVSGSGDWSVSVAGSDLAKETTIHATLVAHDEAGNSASVVADHPYSVDLDPPVATLTIDVVAGDDVVNLDESKVNQTISGKASGEFLAGDLVTFSLNGTEYSAAVNASGDWSVEVAGADLAAETTIHATLVAHDAAGNSASVVADHPYSVDLDPPVATLTINVVAGDDVVNLDESKVSQTISGKAGGEFLAGDVVSFKLDGTTYSAAVAANGDWSVTVPGSKLVAETSHQIDATLVAHDAAGNVGNATASHVYSVITDPGTTTLTIDIVAGDDIVNLAESKTNQTISGKVVGTYLAGDKVTFTLNGHAYSASVATDGKWSVSVPGSDLVGDSARSINATVIGHDTAGNASTASASHPYSVEITPPTATLTINVVAGDDVVNLNESLQNHTITGGSSGARAGDIVSIVIDGTTYSTTVNASGNWSIAGVPGSKLVADADHVIDGRIIASDAAGNTSEATATHAYAVHTAVPDIYLYIDKITGDDVIDASEAATSQPITGTTTGTNPGDVLKLTLNGVVYSTTVNASGAWSVTVPGSELVADANHRVAAEVKSTDQWGNSATTTASHNYVVEILSTKPTIDEIFDDVGLITGPIARGGITDDPKPDLSGTADANSTVAIYDNGGKIGSTTADGNGQWTFTPTTPLSEGKHDFTVDATNAAGSTSAKSDVFTIITDYAPPVATLSIDVIAGNDLINYAKSQTEQTVSGKAGGEFTSGDLVSFSLNGHAYSAAVNASGTWSVAVAGGDLAAADNIQATLVAHNAAGNSTNVVANHGYNVDLVSTTPVITSVYDAVGDKQGNLVPGETTDDTRPKISGTAEANSTVKLYEVHGSNAYLGETTADGNGNWTYTPSTDLAQGPHAIRVQATDLAGNFSEPSNIFDFTVEIAAPLPATPVIVSVYDDVGAKQGYLVQGEITDDSRPTINGTSEPNRIVVLYDNADKIGSTIADDSGNWSYTPSIDLANGAHNIVARADDGAGRLSGVSNEFGFTVDVVPPVIPAPVIISVYDAVGAKQGYLVQGETTDDNRPTINGTAEANKTITIYDQGTAIGVTNSNGSGSWSFNPTTDLADGVHSITAKASDGVGNTSEASNAFGFIVSVPIPPSGTTGVEEFDGWSGGNGTLASGLVVGGSGYKTVTNATLGAGGDDSGKAFMNCIHLHSGTVRLTLPGEGAMRASFMLGGVDETGTTQIYYYDADGNVLGSVLSVYQSLYYKWNETSFTAPVGKLISYIEVTTNDINGIGIDYVAWGQVLQSSQLLQKGQAEVGTDSAEAAAASHVSDHEQVAEQAHNSSTASVDTVAVQDVGQSDSTQPQETDSHGSAPLATLAVATHATTLSDVVPAVDIAGLSDTYYGESDSYVALHNAEAYLASDANQGIHGAAGVDTLAVAGHDQVLDLTAAHGKVTGMEVIDLTGDGQAHNSLKLSLEDVLDNGQADLFHSSDSHSVQMLVKGDSSDVVNLDHHSSNGTDSTWSDKGTVAVGDISYRVYQNSSTEAELLIQQGVQVHLV
ncbi:Ig-like domain-containing protein, partial [Pseudomonas pseudonitroreducens]